MNFLKVCQYKFIHFISYTRQVMNETLRISPVGPFAARESPDHEIRIQVTYYLLSYFKINEN